MAINKVIYGNKTLIDLTSDTVGSSTLAEGITAHDKSGNLITGKNKAGNTCSVTISGSKAILGYGCTRYVNNSVVATQSVADSLSNFMDGATLQNVVCGSVITVITMAGATIGTTGGIELLGNYNECYFFKVPSTKSSASTITVSWGLYPSECVYPNENLYPKDS